MANHGINPNDVRHKFGALRATVRLFTLHCSAPIRACDGEAYRAIANVVAMGWDAVPFLIEDFRRQHVIHEWFAVLRKITGVNPAASQSHSSKTRDRVKAWIDWYDSLPEEE